MAYEYYVSSGFCHTPTEEDPRYGVAELVFYNPNSVPTEATITAYFEKRVPYVLPGLVVKGQTNASLDFPAVAPEVFSDCGFWGARIESTAPLAVNILSGYHLMRGEQLFTGGSTSFNATKLGHSWQFPDGLWLEWVRFYNNDRTNAPFPFNEIEHYMVLNPHPEDLEAQVTLQYQRREHPCKNVLLRGERMWVWDNYERVDYNAGYAFKVTAPQPIAASAVRYIYGLDGFDTWGVQVHCAMLAVPGNIGQEQNHQEVRQ